MYQNEENTVSSLRVVYVVKKDEGKPVRDLISARDTFECKAATRELITQLLLLGIQAEKIEMRSPTFPTQTDRHVFCKVGTRFQPHTKYLRHYPISTCISCFVSAVRCTCGSADAQVRSLCLRLFFLLDLVNDSFKC